MTTALLPVPAEEGRSEPRGLLAMALKWARRSPWEREQQEGEAIYGEG